jgi:rhamnose utilization protein RhaD (predicted bifunctional aldolase and dehydrogenase)/NAD(P)-dependent dehydrogenase (short-subunit alcohol dehydrogenase family)
MSLKHLQNLWSDREAAEMDEPELLRYRSNLLGSDLRLTNFGGGNTSAKVPQVDPVTGETVEVLWVKGSGGDLGSIKRDGFATLYLDRLLALKGKYKGVEEEDAMADMYPLCTFNNNPRAASIDTPLHGFLPFRHVDHLHPDWAIALAASENGQEHLEKLYEETGIRLAWLPWKRPGFELGLWLEKAAAQPDLDGVILASHGLFTWGETSRESYENTLRVIDAIGDYVLRRMDAATLFGGPTHDGLAEKAGLLALLIPRLRGLAGGNIAHFSDGEEVMRFVNSRDAERLAWLGTSCPDHFVRTRVRPLFLKDPENLEAAFEEYAQDYTAYYEANKLPDSPKMRGAAPTVVLIPGVGMVSLGKNKTEARITGEFYINAINVMAGATSLANGMTPSPWTGEGRGGGDGLPSASGTSPSTSSPSSPGAGGGGLSFNNYVALPPREAFTIEYWKLEEAKLQRMPPEKEMSRKIAVLIGASPGIGRNVAELLLGNGAHVVIADINQHLANTQAEELKGKYGKEVVSSARVDITDRDSVKQLMKAVSLQFGGVDALISIAAVFIPPDRGGRLTDEQVKKTYEINVLGQMLLAEEAAKVMSLQKSKGSIVLVSSANAVVPKKGSVAYDTSKAALNHLIRELAIELSPNVRVNAVAPATVVEGSQMFPRDRVIASLAKYEIPFQESDSDDELRSKLANFYAQRTLLKAPVSPKKVAEAIYSLATDRYSLTTGHIIPVDAGLSEAFMR